jgi:hypothetical protein
MSVTVTPQTFNFVAYDAALIQRVAEELLQSLGLADRDLNIEVDETTPLARTRVEVGDAISIRAESGAFEDTRRPRQQSEVATATSLGRVLLRVRDRLNDGFGDAPPDEDLTLAQVAAWETYSVGRLERLGIDVNQQRWRYNFRNRHGFTDAADQAFNRLWAGDALTWDELEAISAAAGQPDSHS